MTIILLSLRLMVPDPLDEIVASRYCVTRLRSEPDYADAWVDGELVYTGPGVALEWPPVTDMDWHQYVIEYRAGYGASFKACTNDPAQPR